MKWLFLVHQVHTRNSRERVKVWRSLKKIGAVLHRNSVYVLPYSNERLEDFQWVCQQINDSRGEASVFVSEAQDAKEDRLLRRLFEKAREEEYSEILKSAQRLLEKISSAKKQKKFTDLLHKNLEKEAKQLREVSEDIRKIDFFSDAPPRKITKVLEEITKALLRGSPAATALSSSRKYSPKEFQGKTWTTREGIHIDRICSAWLIRRFIDPSAQFIFAPERQLPKNAIPFDVFGAEFSHHGEDCTFETLIKSFQLQDPALEAIAEIIHDIDLKDHKYGSPEAPGIDAIIRALSESIQEDQRLLEAGSGILDALYNFYSKQGGYGMRDA